MAEPAYTNTSLRPEPVLDKSHVTRQDKPNKAIQKYQKGEKVSMSVTEGGVKRRKDFTVDSAEHSEVDNKWIYSLKTKDGVWKGGQFFREADLTFTR